jgi:hypothetical protein
MSAISHCVQRKRIDISAIVQLDCRQNPQAAFIGVAKSSLTPKRLGARH